MCFWNKIKFTIYFFVLMFVCLALTSTISTQGEDFASYNLNFCIIRRLLDIFNGVRFARPFHTAAHLHFDETSSQ